MRQTPASNQMKAPFSLILKAHLIVWICVSIIVYPFNASFGLIPTLEYSPEKLDLPLELLMRVRVLGAVAHEGMYYVPKGTDLASLLSHAGGITNAEEIFVKRTVGKKKYHVFAIDKEDFFEKSEHPILVLAQDDIVMVPATVPLISDNAIKLVTIISATLAIALTTLVLTDRF